MATWADEWQNEAHKLKRALERIDESEKIYPDNKKTIKEFKDFLVAEGLSTSRIRHYMGLLRKLAEEAGNKPFQDMNRRDVEKLVAWSETLNLAMSTRVYYRVSLRKLFAWMRQNENPPETSWIKTVLKKTSVERIKEDDLVTEKDLKKLLKACTGPRQECFIMMLYEGGFRPHEIASITIGDLRVEARYVDVYVSKSKTSAYRDFPVTLVNSKPFIAKWLSLHPDKNNKESPLFVSTCPKAYGRLPKYSGFKTMFREMKKRAGLKKNINLYRFRHTHSTYLDDIECPDHMQKKRLGLSPNSRAFQGYKHHSRKKVRSGYLQLMGVVDSEHKPVKLAPYVKCYACGMQIAETDNRCFNCGVEFSSEKIEELKHGRDLREKLNELKGRFETDLFGVLLMSDGVEKIRRMKSLKNRLEKIREMEKKVKNP